MELDPKNINALNEQRDKKLLEIAQKVDPSDEEAIDMYAQEMATDICRAAFRDIAASMKANMGDKGKDLDYEKLAEQALPNTDFYREAVSDLKKRIYDAMRSIGKVNE